MNPRSIGEILTTKEHEMKMTLDNARKTLTIIRYASNTT